jgi:hypothetical protein
MLFDWTVSIAWLNTHCGIMFQRNTEGKRNIDYCWPWYVLHPPRISTDTSRNVSLDEPRTTPYLCPKSELNYYSQLSILRNLQSNPPQSRRFLRLQTDQKQWRTPSATQQNYFPPSHSMSRATQTKHHDPLRIKMQGLCMNICASSMSRKSTKC